MLGNKNRAHPHGIHARLSSCRLSWRLGCCNCPSSLESCFCAPCVLQTPSSPINSRRSWMLWMPCTIPTCSSMLAYMTSSNRVSHAGSPADLAAWQRHPHTHHVRHTGNFVVHRCSCAWLCLLFTAVLAHGCACRRWWGAGTAEGFSGAAGVNHHGEVYSSCLQHYAQSACQRMTVCMQPGLKPAALLHFVRQQ